MAGRNYFRKHGQNKLDYWNPNLVANKSIFSTINNSSGVEGHNNVVHCTICRKGILEHHMQFHVEHHFNREIKPAQKSELSTQDAMNAMIKTYEAAGWDIKISETVSYDGRRGFSISALEPKKEETNAESK
jgi:hypothetical protein